MQAKLCLLEREIERVCTLYYEIHITLSKIRPNLFLCEIRILENRISAINSQMASLLELMHNLKNYIML